MEIQKEFVKDHIKKHNEQLITLSTAAETQPGCLSEKKETEFHFMSNCRYSLLIIESIKRNF